MSYAARSTNRLNRPFWAKSAALSIPKWKREERRRWWNYKLFPSLPSTDILILYYHIFNNHAGFVKSTFKKFILLSFYTGFSIGFASVFSTDRTGLSALPCNFEVFYSRSESSSFSSWMVGVLATNMLKIYLTTELFLRKVRSSIYRIAVRMPSLMILLML